MKRYLQLTFLTGLLFAIPATAQIDPDPDGIGIYFDLAATNYCDQVEAYSLFELYLVLTNASAEGGVHGWECQIQYDPVLMVLIWDAVGYDGSFFTPPDFSLGLAEPLPWAPAIHLLTMTCMVLSTECTWLHLEPYSVPAIPGEIAYVDGSDPWHLIPLYPSTGGYGQPVAGVNCDCPPPVAATRTSWGFLKALFH